MELEELLIGKLSESFSIRGDGVLRYHERLCMPYVDDLRN